MNRALKLFIIFTLLASAIFNSAYPGSAKALSGSEFKAGHIIDDSNFFNPNALSAAGVQDFLNSKLPTCDTNGTQAYGGTTRRLYSISRGYPPPFICLNNYSQTIPGMAADSYCTGNISAGTKSSAQIIYDIGKACGISQKALIVLIQKESGLVTDDWPWPNQYNTITGYGCPDGGSCDPAYAGFFKQVYYAARQFQKYAQSPDSFSYKSGRNNNILYNPNSSCGSSSVYIVNQATAGLYNYTPYQPNSAALSNLYGLGNPCSAYGNRNFWRIYNDWFGDPIGPSYSFYSATNPPSRISFNKVVSAELVITNNSGETWYSDGHTPAGVRPYRLMLRGYQDTAFANSADPAWLGTKNQIRMVDTVVLPGDTATFDFTLKAPNTRTSENLNMLLVQDGVEVHEDLGLQFKVLAVPDYDYSVVSIDAPPAILPGDLYRITIRLQNTGGEPWYSDGNNPSGVPAIRLATPYYKDTPFAYPSVDSAWLGTRNQIKLLDTRVDPARIGTFTAIIGAPYRQIDDFTHNFSLVANGYKFVNGGGMPVTISVPDPIATYSVVSVTPPPTTMHSGDTAQFTVRLTNTGNILWRNHNRRVESSFSDQGSLRDTRMLTWAPGYRASVFADSSSPEWLGTDTQTTMVEPIIVPNKTGTFTAIIKAPVVTTTTKYTEKFNLVVDGYTVMPDQGLSFTVTVSP